MIQKDETVLTNNLLLIIYTYLELINYERERKRFTCFAKYMCILDPIEYIHICLYILKQKKKPVYLLNVKHILKNTVSLGEDEL